MKRLRRFGRSIALGDTEAARLEPNELRSFGWAELKELRFDGLNRLRRFNW